MALIEFKNVNKYYGDYHALRDINLEIEKGQVVVLLGPSGSGKSTLIRTINALESIDNGTLIVNGHNVTEASAKDLVELRKEAGMVFQHFNLYPHKTVLENVTLAPIKVLGISKAEAEKTAEKFLRYVYRRFLYICTEFRSRYLLISSLLLIQPYYQLNRHQL